MQSGDEVRATATQLALQQVGEEVMIAIPAPLVVQRNKEEVGRQQALQQVGAVAAPGHGIAQVAVQPGQNRGVQQELLHRGRLAGQHLLGQVAQDEAVGSAEGLDKGRGIGAALQGKAGQLQAGGPPLGARGETGQVRLGQS